LLFSSFRGHCYSVSVTCCVEAIFVISLQGSDLRRKGEAKICIDALPYVKKFTVLQNIDVTAEIFAIKLYQ